MCFCTRIWRVTRETVGNKKGIDIKMKIFDGMGPNPRFVHMFVIEKGLTIPAEPVDLMAGQNREGAHLNRNPMGQLPCLETDTGSMISEITAIGEYLEEQHPTPALVGTNAEERAEARMWTRRIDLNVCEPLVAGFRYGEGLGIFKDRMRTIPEAADGLKSLKHDNLVKLDGLLAGKAFLCGDRLTMADILLFSFLDFGAIAGQPLDPELSQVQAHFERMGARPSAAASLEPVAAGGSISG